jgi:hypothetical protein
MEPNVGADVHMLVNESEFFIGKKKRSRKVSNNSEFSLEK